MENLLSASHIVYRCHGLTVLDDISLSISRGDILTVIGPNGAGKSTLVKILIGQLTADSGTITRTPNTTIGYVPQRMAIDPALPVTVQRFLNLPHKRPKEEVTQALEDVQAEALLTRDMRQLSGGELQRVLLARAVLQKPDLLVLDEPDQGVDVDGQIRLYEHLQHLQQSLNCAMLIVSHELHLVMAASTKVYCLNRHLCCAGTPDDVRQHPEFVALFGPRAAEILAPYQHDHDHSHAWGRHDCSEHHHD